MKQKRTAPTEFDWRAWAAAHTVLLIIVGATVLGLAARLFALTYAPRYSYSNDHADFMAWSLEAYENGPTNIYKRVNRPRRGQPWLINYRTFLPNSKYIDGPRAIPHPCNYPPLSTYVFWAQGGLWRALAEDNVTTELRSAGQHMILRRNGPEGNAQIPISPQDARALQFWPDEVVRGPIANTFIARLVGALPSVIFDFLLAWGVGAVVRRLSGHPHWCKRSAIAFGLTLLAPPIILDSAFWNQADSWIAALLVWCLYFLIARRWIIAGLVFGAALLVKPQAILLGPVLVFILAAQRLRAGGAWRGLVGPVVMGVVSLIAAFVFSLPHTIAGIGYNTEVEAAGTFGAATEPRHISSWFDIVYGDLVFGESYPRTTFNAFNVWWFHFLGNYRNATAIDPTAPAVAGLSKDTLGKCMLGGCIVLAWWLAGRKWRWSEHAWLAVAAIVTLAAFALPTRVHERYIYLCIPFFIALAALRPIWSLPLICLLIVGTFEMTAFGWAGALQDTSVRNFSSLLAVLTCLAMITAILMLIPRDKSPTARGARAA